MVPLLVFPGGAKVMPTIWAHFGEEKSKKEVCIFSHTPTTPHFLPSPLNLSLSYNLLRKVPIFQTATNLGGWMTVKNSIEACSYHTDLQTITTPLVMSGHIYHVFFSSLFLQPN
jgi:hypothetical protein